jgi:ribonucleoside-triphosphate reductase (thioredoxin)
LSEIVIRHGDSEQALKRKVEIATIIGTFQSTLTNYRYIRKQWTTNAEEERLLGVSMTGIMDHELLATSARATESLLQRLKDHAIETNKQWATKLGISASTAITTVKPSGTVSQLVDSASGIHPRYSDYYIRTVRADSKDPLALFMQANGFPVETDVMNKNNLVFSFPVKAPENAVKRNDRTALEQLEHYLVFKKYWCEHNPSITVYVREDEWLEVAAWVYKNLEFLGGVSFLPHNDHAYQQAPYQEINAETFAAAVTAFPEVDWVEFDKYEVDDATVSMKEMACVAGHCEIL